LNDGQTIQLIKTAYQPLMTLVGPHPCDARVRDTPDT